MNTIRDAIDAFLHFYEDRTGRPSQSISYPPKLIYYYLNMYHKRVLFQEKFRRSTLNIDEGIIQTIPCVELRKADQIECPCAPPSGCYFLKSLHPLPKLLDGLPLTVSTLAPDCHNCEKEIREFDYVRWYNMQYKINSRVEAQQYGLYYTMKDIDLDTHLYVYTSDRYPELKAVAVSGVFKDPLEVLHFPLCGEKSRPVCNVLDQEFHIEQELQAQVFELVFQALIQYRAGTPAGDIMNNSNNDSTVPVQP